MMIDNGSKTCPLLKTPTVANEKFRAVTLSTDPLTQIQSTHSCALPLALLGLQTQDEFSQRLVLEHLKDP
jgi:hypothetical protein